MIFHALFTAPPISVQFAYPAIVSSPFYELGILLVPSFSSSDIVRKIFWRRGDDDLPKMSEPCRTDRELDDVRPQNDHPAIGPVGLCESELSAPVAERIG